MKKLIRKTGRKIFRSLGLNFSLYFHYKHGNTFKAQKKLLNKENPVIFDVGAFDGRTAKAYQQYFAQPTIHSFEPFPQSFQQLSQNKLPNNHYLNPFALADSNGTATFYINDYTATNSLLPSTQEGIDINKAIVTKQTIEVPQQTLDSYCASKGITAIDILKIDVQGAELKVLQGAKEMITHKKIKLIYFETEFRHFYENQPLFDEISLYLRHKGYHFIALYNMSYTHDGKMVAADALFEA